MASMKKVMFGALLFFIAFELISCTPVVDVRPQPELSISIFTLFFSLVVYSFRFLNKVFSIHFGLFYLLFLSSKVVLICHIFVMQTQGPHRR